MTGEIRVHREGVAATVTMDHPGKLNALTVAMWQDLARVMRELSAEIGRAHV